MSNKSNKLKLAKYILGRLLRESYRIFFNAQIRRTRIFFRVDNALSDFGTRNYFSAPNYPYRDFTIRFGLVWNWFI